MMLEDAEVKFKFRLYAKRLKNLGLEFTSHDIKIRRLELDVALIMIPTRYT